MRSKRWTKWILCGAAVAACAGLALALPEALARSWQPGDMPPPGVPRPRRELVTAWVCADVPGASAWLRSRAAAYGKAHPGVTVWLRSVSAGELDSGEAVPPDLLFFSPGAYTGGGARLLCASGYVLVQPGEAAVTPAPRSLFGVSPTPDGSAPPLPQTPAWPEHCWADDGFGAVALRALGAPGADFCPAAEAVRHFRAGEAALLPVARLTAGEEGRLIAAAPVTDLALYGAALAGASETARGFLEELTTPEAQRALADRGLISCLPELRLYGPDRPLLAALEAALARGGALPSGIAPAEKQAMILAAQAAYGK